MRAFVLALALMLGGCSASEVVQNYWTGAPVADLSQPDYRGIIAANLNSIFPKGGKFSDMEISGLRQVEHLKGPAWMTCLKLDAHGSPHSYAIFIQDGKIIESRTGIVIDQCHKETYTPFDPATAAVKVGT